MLQENVGLMWFLTLQSVMQSKRLKSFLMATDVMCTLKQQGVLSLWNKGQSIIFMVNLDDVLQAANDC